MITLALSAAKMASSIGSMFGQASLARSQARIAETNARIARTTANRKATQIENAAKANQRIAGENMMRARSNQRDAVGKVRTERANSGFTSEGSGNDAEESAQKALDKHIANMALDASITMMNSWQQAADVRQQGELEAVKQEGAAEVYRIQADYAKSGAIASLVAGTLGAAHGFYKNYTEAQQSNSDLAEARLAADNTWHNSNASQAVIDENLALNKQIYDENVLNPWKQGFMGAAQLGGASTDITGSMFGMNATPSSNTFSAFISSFSTDNNARKNNWGGAQSVSSGNVPYKVPAAGTIFSTFI